jgi:ribosomal protein S18 acetylase RimI-like enzyme
VTGAPYSLRRTTAADAAFLAEMLAEAASWERAPGEPPYPLADLLAIPQIAAYIEDWGRAGDGDGDGDGDGGIVAEIEGRPAGACWFRRFTAERPAYGFLGEDVPGLGLGVAPAHRRRGLGTALLAATIKLACEQGAAALSLSVSERNQAARRLYDQAGFVVVRREGDSLTMRLDLVDDPGADPA